MEGVTTAIVAFLLVCVVFPTLVKNKPLYYAAFAAVLVIILLSGLEVVVAGAGFMAFATFMICLLQIVALVLLVLAAGGLTLRQLAGEVTEAIEVIRRGETSKEVIIPLHGEMPRAEKPAPPPASPIRLDDADSSVPLE
jgi:hypothetical protein